MSSSSTFSQPNDTWETHSIKHTCKRISSYLEEYRLLLYTLFTNLQEAIKVSDIFGKIKRGVVKVGKETDKVVDIKRVEMEIRSTNKQMDDLYHKLGEMVYESKAINAPENPEVAGIVAKISDLTHLIISKEEEINDIKAGKVTTPMPEPGKRFCTNCGKLNEADSKFCAECGAKMD
jgi:zinc-ribbon domain